MRGCPLSGSTATIPSCTRCTKPCCAGRSHHAWFSTSARTTACTRCAFSSTARACWRSSPNPYRHQWIRAWCAANRVACELEPVAVGGGRRDGGARRPCRQHVHGKHHPGGSRRWRDANVDTVTVRQVALDDVVAERGLVPDLVKIDTEGAELAVLRDAVEVLRAAHPMLVFESWRAPEARRDSWTMLDKHGYATAPVNG